ncbi:hypothetical protein [Yersinia similis]|uniref:hypothetical protein n=1 Tax=Yersinia similis TaxID=367190 RepID=UPI003851427A
MKLKINFFSTLVYTATFCSGLSFAHAQALPDVYSVVERKLENALPLAEHPHYDAQAPYFELHREILMFSSPERANTLLKKLDFSSKEAMLSLNLSADWIAGTGNPDKAMVFLSQIGLEKPSSFSAYKSYVDAWIEKKQPEYALKLLMLDNNARSYYLPSVLEAYRDTPDQAVTIYKDIYGDKIVEPTNQLRMLLAIAENYRVNGDPKNTLIYTDKAQAMFIDVLKKKQNNEIYFYQDYLNLINLYSFAGNKQQTLILSEQLLRAAGDKGTYYDLALSGIMAFYYANGFTEEYNALIATSIASTDKSFSFAPKPIEEIKLIRLLNATNETGLIKERIDKLMTSSEYACYDDRYCYEYKIESLNFLYLSKYDALADKYLNIIIKESQNQTFNPWETVTKSIVKKLVDIGRIAEAKKLATDAEVIYLSQLKDYPPKEVERNYRDLAEMYGFAGDVVSAERILNKHVTTAQNYFITDLFIKNKQWDEARARVVKDTGLSGQNLTLLKNICATNTPECMQHITFTLKSMLTRESITAEDASGNQQLYQLGIIYHSLGIKPTEEQQLLIQKLYDNAAA